MRNVSEIKYGWDARNKMILGVEQLANAVSVTLGPKGKNVAIIKNGKRPHLTKDGVTVANSINLPEPFENLGCQIVKEAAQRTADVAGDGTTTSTVLAASLLAGGHRLLGSGFDTKEVVSGIEAASNDILQELETTKIDLDTLAQLESVATISANGEEEIGKIIAEAIDRVGADGPIVVENAKGFDTNLEIVEGTVIDRGFLSPYFVTNQSKSQAELDKVLILLYDQTLSSAQEIMPFLEHAASAKVSLLIVAHDVANEALQTLVLNRMKGVINVCAIKAPEFGNARHEALQDMSIVCGGSVITANEINKQINLNDYLGYAEKAIIDKFGTLLVGTAGKKDVIEKKIEELRDRLETPGLPDGEVHFVHRRIRRLSDGIAMIRVGGNTEGELFERRDRVDDALCAARTAKKSGIQPGGGIALLQAAQRVKKCQKTTHAAGYDAGYSMLLDVCGEPLRQIIENAGGSPDLILEKVLKGGVKKPSRGYNIITEQIGDMFEMNIIDPHDVVTSTLLHATSVAINILMIGCTISITESEEEGEALGLLDEL